VQNINAAPQSHRVDRAIRIALVILDNLKDARAAKSMERLRVRMLVAILSIEQCLTDEVLDVLRKRTEVIARRGDPIEITPPIGHGNSISILIYPDNEPVPSFASGYGEPIRDAFAAYGNACLAPFFDRNDAANRE
jgi:hypothetical protein